MNAVKKGRILVVDDEITVCKSIRQAILSEEVEVDTALSGEEALKKDADVSYDLVITDLMMPGISGMDLLKILREQRPSASIIMITGYPTIKTAVEAVRLGAFDYLPKPFTPAELRSLVSRAFRSTEEAAEKLGARAARMPAGLYYMLGHTWLKTEEDNTAVVGVVHEFIAPVGAVTGVDLPVPGKSFAQGDMCAKITDAEKFIHRIWAPAGGKVIEVNSRLHEDPSPLRSDPYGQGWLFRMEPTNLEEDLKGLILSK